MPTPAPFSSEQSGFTLVELVIAMAVFSFMLLIVSAAFISIVRVHQMGLSSRTTQQNARFATEDIERYIRVASSAIVNPAVPVLGTFSQVCLFTPNQIIVYAVDGAPSFSLHQGTTIDSTCGIVPKSTVTNWRRITDDSVEVTQFMVSNTGPFNGTLGTVSIDSLAIVSENDRLNLTPDRTKCTGGEGSQFCSVTNIATAANLRGTP